MTRRADLFDVRHPWFRPLWSRALLVAVTLGWALVEFTSGSPFFGILSAAAGLYCAWAFFVVFDPKDYERPPKDDTDTEETGS